MTLKTDDDKAKYLESILKIHLESNTPTTLLAVLLAFSKVTAGSSGISLQDVAKVIKSATGETVNICESFKIGEGDWK